MPLEKLAEPHAEQLAEVVGRLAAVVDHSNDAFIITALDGTILSWNRAAERTYGYTAREAVGRSVQLIVPAERSDYVGSDLEKVRRRELVETHEVQGVRKDGRRITVSLSVSPVTDGIGCVVAAATIARDVTERNKRALREGEELCREIFENARDIIYTQSLDGRFTSINRAVERITGYTTEEALGLSMAEVVAPEYLEVTRRNLAEKLAGKSEAAYEIEVIAKDGRRVPLEVNSRLIFRGGVPVGVQGIARDITERKRIEEELRRTQQLIRAIIDNSPAFIYVKDLEGRLMLANRESVRALGQTEESVLGKTTHDLLDRETADQHCANDLHVIETGEPLVVEESNPQEDGVHTYYSVKFPLLGEEGRPFAVGGISTDITEYKRAGRELAEANRRAITEYEQLLERIAVFGQALGTARDLTGIFRALHEFARASAPCNGIFISLYDAERNERQAVFACTDGVELDVRHFPPMPMSESPHSRAVLTGKIIVEGDFQRAVVGQPAYHVGMDADPRAPRSSLVVPMAVMGRTIGAVELQSVEPDAFTREHVTAMRMAANLAAAAIENVRLIEQERESAAQLRQAQKMEAVGRLAGGIAHDFNNLLTVINGYIDLSIRRVDEYSVLHRNLEEIRKAGERAASLTRQLLAFSRKQVLQPKVLSLNTVITDVEKMLHRLIGEDVELLTRLDERVRPVLADPGQIEQVIINLAVNARDAMPQGGKLSIATSNVHLDEEYASRHVAVRPGNYVMLSVTDNGCGMDSETQKRIFEPFFTTKGGGKGTGLGLSTVYGIVKQSGGNIWVYSELGIGSTLKVYLPVADGEADLNTTEGRMLVEPRVRGVETILLAEDDDLVRRMAKEILEESGYTVLAASGGGEAVRLCESHRGTIHLLLTDVVMPQLSGRELADGLTLVRPSLKVLYMSGYTDEAIVHHGVLDEGVAFIQKPFTPAGLARKVREVLDADRT